MGISKKLAPLDNDWLYRCPAGMETSRIADALGAHGYYLAEVSAARWREAHEAFWAVAVGLGYQNMPHMRSGEISLSDPFGYPGPGMIAALDVKRRPESQYDARELIVIRQCAAISANLLDDLLERTHGPKLWKRSARKRGVGLPRRIVVLEGWAEPTIEPRHKIRTRPALVVNPLPEEFADS